MWALCLSSSHFLLFFCFFLTEEFMIINSTEVVQWCTGQCHKHLLASLDLLWLELSEAQHVKTACSVHELSFISSWPISSHKFEIWRNKSYKMNLFKGLRSFSGLKSERRAAASLLKVSFLLQREMHKTSMPQIRLQRDVREDNNHDLIFFCCCSFNQCVGPLRCDVQIKDKQALCSSSWLHCEPSWWKTNTQKMSGMCRDLSTSPWGEAFPNPSVTGGQSYMQQTCT